MNPNMGWQFIELALSLVKTQASGNIQQEAEVADVLVQIIAKAMQAYRDHTGEPLNPDLIHIEPAI